MNNNERRLELKEWFFMFDQADVGESLGFLRPDYDHSVWTRVSTCRCWETYDASLADYEGPAWYYTEAPSFDGKGCRNNLHFDGVGGRAWIYLNGVLVGYNFNRYLPFDVDLGNAAEEGGKLCITVKVDNRPEGREGLPGGVYDPGKATFASYDSKIEWVLYGGLNHAVYLEEKLPVRIASLRVKADADGSLRAAAEVINSSHRGFAGKLQLRIPALELEKEEILRLPAGEKSVKIFRFRAEDPVLWSPENPHLYDLEAELLHDTGSLQIISERIGFRTAEVRGTDILLNGKPYLLKGANRYDEYAPYGSCPPEELIRKDLMQMKELGINIVRVHYPQDPVHYEIADEVGLLYMLEVPLNWWRPDPEETLDDYAKLRDAAVDALDREYACFGNHPCWAFWSLGNECAPYTQAGQAMFRMLADRMRSYDAGRPITLALNADPDTSEQVDFCDFISLNYYVGSLCDTTEERRNKLREKQRGKFAAVKALYPDKPIVMTEFGLCCIAGMHGDPDRGRFTEEFAAKYLENVCSEFMREPEVKGLIVWSWADYRHRRNFIARCTSMGLSATYGPYGLVTADRKVKKATAEAMKKVFERFVL